MKMQTTRILLACLAASLPNQGGAEEISIDSFPDLARHFKITPYLSVAKSLQDRGRDDALGQLRSWADSGKYEYQVIILCRMLFEARKGVEFRRPQIGGAVFMSGTGYSDWPLEPIDIHDGVPILITHGYILAGSAELSSGYLDFCIENCHWRQDRYSVRPPEELKKIIDKWLAQRKWPEPLSPRDRAFFTDQAEQDDSK